MSELVVIVPDLYLGAGSIPAAAHGSALPGLAHLARYGAVQALPGGWRAWLARSLGSPEAAAMSPATVAAASEPAWHDARPFVWLADPVHLLAGMTSLHLAPRGLLALDPPAQAQLCESFDAAFAERGFHLRPTRSGRFLASGAAPPAEMQPVEPARLLGSSIAEALPRGAGAAALLALGAEIEMWLHEHPLNARRARAGLPTVSALWLWGGGPRLDEGGGDRRAGTPGGGGSARAAVFSEDAFMAGLAQLTGMRIAAGPPTLGQVVADSAPRRIVTVELLGARAAPDPGRAADLEALDREWLAPAVRRLARRELGRLTLVANDRRLSVAASDRLRVWRRRRSALEVLQ